VVHHLINGIAAVDDIIVFVENASIIAAFNGNLSASVFDIFKMGT